MAKLELESGTDVLLLESGDALLLEEAAVAAGYPLQSIVDKLISEGLI